MSSLVLINPMSLQEVHKMRINLFMKSIVFLVFIFNSASCGFYGVKREASTVPVSTELSYLRGVNIMDLGMAADHIPGIFNTNYTKPTLANFEKLKADGVDVVRLPFLWERVQPTLGGVLDSTYLEYILESLRFAQAAGVKIILTMHNFGGYNISGSVYRFGEDEGPTESQFADIWTKLATAIKADPNAYAAIYAYDIMNEPSMIPDSRNSVPSLPANLLFSFASGIGTWSADMGAAVSHDATVGDGALRFAETPAAGSGTEYSRISIGAADHGALKANGSTFKFKGKLTTSAGTYPRIRMTMISSGYATYASPAIEVSPGARFYLHFSPETFVNLGDGSVAPADLWDTHVRIDIELLVNDPTGGTSEVFIEEIYHGNIVTGLSPEKTWESFSQTAVDAIRTVDTSVMLMIEGYGFAAASRWATYHPTKWIDDPSDKIMYHAHQYFDTDGSGTYALSFTAETANAISEGYASVSERAVARVKVFTDWVDSQQVKGFMGEFGWPNSVMVPGDANSWDQVGEDFMDHLDSVNMGATIWATGTWLDGDDYILNAYDLLNFAPLSPAIVLKRHPSH